MPSKNDQIQQQSSEKNNHQQAPAKHTVYKYRKPLTVIALLLFFIATIGMVAYSSYINHQLHEVFNNKIHSLQQALQTMETQQSQLEQHVDSKLHAFKHAQNNIQTELESLNEDLQKALAQHFYQTKDWLLLKARYYLQLAQINAYWTNNVEATNALLKMADKILANVHDKELFKVRQSIAETLIQLESLPHVDVVGLLSQLEAIQQSIQQLPVKTPGTHGLNTDSISPLQSTPKAWQSKLKESIHLLEKLVVIRHHDANMQPLLSESQISIRREMIRFQLLQAQWAVLQQKQTIFQQALKQAEDQINDTFDTKAPKTKAVAMSLQTLKKVTLSAERVDIEKPLELLNQVITDTRVHQKQSETNEGRS